MATDNASYADQQRRDRELAEIVEWITEVGYLRTHLVRCLWFGFASGFVVGAVLGLVIR
jgi:hypothetical protein